MKHFLPILSIAFCLLLTACGGEEPITYDNVSGHTYVFERDTIYFAPDHTFNHYTTTFWEQDQQLVNTYHYITNEQKVINDVYEAFDKKLVRWNGGSTRIYYRVD